MKKEKIISGPAKAAGGMVVIKYPELSNNPYPSRFKEEKIMNKIVANKEYFWAGALVGIIIMIVVVAIISLLKMPI